MKSQSAKCSRRSKDDACAARSSLGARGATAPIQRSAWLLLELLAVCQWSCGTPERARPGSDVVATTDSADGSPASACDSAPHVVAVTAPLDGAAAKDQCSTGQAPTCSLMGSAYTDRLFSLSDGTWAREDVHLAHCVDSDVSGTRLDPRLHIGDLQLLPPMCWGGGWSPRRTTWIHRVGDALVVQRAGAGVGGALAIVKVAEAGVPAPAIWVQQSVTRDVTDWVGNDGASFVVAHHDTWSFKGGGDHNVVFERFSLAGAAAWSTGTGGVQGRLETAWLDDQGQVQALLTLDGGAKGESQALRWVVIAASGAATDVAPPSLWPSDRVGSVSQIAAIDGWPQRRLVVAQAKSTSAKPASATSVAWIGAGGILVGRADGLELGIVMMAASGRPDGTLRLVYRAGTPPYAVPKVQDFDEAGNATSMPHPLQPPGSASSPWLIRQVALRGDDVIAVATLGKVLLKPSATGALDTLVTLHDGGGALTHALNIGVPGDDEPTAIAWLPDRLALVRKAAAVGGKACAESDAGAKLLPLCVREVEVRFGCP